MLEVLQDLITNPLVVAPLAMVFGVVGQKIIYVLYLHFKIGRDVTLFLSNETYMLAVKLRKFTMKTIKDEELEKKVLEDLDKAGDSMNMSWECGIKGLPNPNKK